MTREKNCSAITTGKTSLKTPASQDGQALRFPIPRVAWRRKRKGGPRRCCSSRKSTRCFLMNCAQRQPSASSRRHATEAHRHQDKHEQSHCQVRGKGAIAHCTPTCSILQAGACFGQDAGHSRRTEEQRAECFEHGGEDLPDTYRRLVVAKTIYVEALLW